MADETVGRDTQHVRKRKRAAAACTSCHDRKVRCNVALQGIPCTNCAQDGVPCKVYGQQSVARPGQPIQPRKVPSDATGISPLTPSSGSGKSTEFFRQPVEVLEGPQAKDTANTSPTTKLSSGHHGKEHVNGHLRSHEQPILIPGNARSERALWADTGTTLVPYYGSKQAGLHRSKQPDIVAGEAKGLEFLFDIAAPDRPLKGGPYIVSRNSHKREWPKAAAYDPHRPMLPDSLCQQLIRCFFHHVFPFMPVVNAGDFLTKYTEDPNKVSRILLWSMFFSSTTFVDPAVVEAADFKDRRSLKEYCYQSAKAIYDAQQESDKTNIISSALLLGFWFVDLEEIDGAWNWIGTASNLAQSIGLHREPNYAQIPRCPFPPSLQALWRRLWWCCHYRDAWLAVALGRPMRIHLDDCDTRIPNADDVLEDLRDLPASVKDAYIPPDLNILAELWIVLLHLSIKLEDVLLLHYRPRRPRLSLSQLEKDDADIWQLLENLPRETELWSRNLILHLCHLRCYFNTVTITLHRPYILSQPHYLMPVEQSNLKATAIQRSKSAAASVTSILNRLIALDLIDFSPTMLVTAMMAPMQIHVYEYAQSESLARQHAYHNLDLHMLVLAHLKKTFWSAEMQHNLFTECLKAIERSKQPGSVETPRPESTPASSLANTREDHSYDMSVGSMDPVSLGGDFADDFFLMFNPFSNMQLMFDQSASVDWSTTNQLHLDGP